MASDREVCFFVPGDPRAKGSMKTFRTKSGVNITNDNPKTKPWQIMVGQTAADNWSGPPCRGAIDLALTFYFSRPKGHFGTGRNAGVVKDSAPDYPMKKHYDIDKLARCVLDALSGIVYVDDCQVVVCPLWKFWAPQDSGPGVHVTIRPLEE